MVMLKISLLGSFQAWLGGNPVTSFESNKVRALLAYLAVEIDRPHSRDTIAGLLWPDYPQDSARSNLRWALSSLRRTINDYSPVDSSTNPPHLLVDRECVQFNSLSDYWLDVSIFKGISGQSDFASQPLEHPQIEHIIQAVAVFRGSFLEGFSLPDSAPFEEWVLLRREQLNRSYLHMLSQLADYFESCGEFEQAQRYVWHQIELEPWQEEAHRQLMRLLVLSGRRSEAMNRYEVCRNLLLEGLGVEPSRETRILYEQIRDGLLVSTSPIGAASRHAVENATKPVFVGREK